MVTGLARTRRGSLNPASCASWYSSSHQRAPDIHSPHSSLFCLTSSGTIRSEYTSLKYSSPPSWTENKCESMYTQQTQNMFITFVQCWTNGQTTRSNFTSYIVKYIHCTSNVYSIQIFISDYIFRFKINVDPYFQQTSPRFHKQTYYRDYVCHCGLEYTYIYI